MHKKEFCLRISERVLGSQALQLSSIQVVNDIMNMLEDVLNILQRKHFNQLFVQLRKFIYRFLKIDMSVGSCGQNENVN